MAFETTTEAVGLAAAGAGVVIYEMTAEHFDLEEMFLELTTTEGAIAMNNLIRAELLKLRTTRIVLVERRGRARVRARRASRSPCTWPAARRHQLDSAEGFRNVIAAASSGGVLVLLIGILVMAGEFRHNTVTSTFLITPDRRRVVGAKLAAASLVGVAVARRRVAAHARHRSALAGAAGTSTSPRTAPTSLVVLLGGIAATALGAVVGVGVGALVTNQTLAVTVTLIWMLVVESLVGSFAPGIGRWLPGGAAGAMSGAATYSNLLPVGAAALLFAGYGLAFAAAGSRFVLRRDIT